MGDEKWMIKLPSSTSEEHSDSACVTRFTRDEKPVHYTLKIQSLSLLKKSLARFNRERYETQEFNAGGYKWKLALYPDGDGKRKGSGHISLYLVMADNNVMLSAVFSVNAVFKFLVYDNLRDRYLTIQDGKTRRFHSLKSEWGFEKLISLETFNDSSNGYLVEDCCAFGVDIFVMKCDEGKGEVFSLVKQPKGNTFTWKIPKFSTVHQTPESSPFVVESYNWRIRVDMQGFSLIFCSNQELPQGFHVYAEYELAVLMQPGVGRERVTCQCWFGGEKNDLGSSNFMSLIGLIEPTKGFILNDTLMVEVKINAISTLKRLS